jgi:site-specific DNA recombinase
VRRVLTDPDVITHEVERQKHDSGQTMQAERDAVDHLLADVIVKQRNATAAILALDDEDAAAPVREALRFLSEQRKGLEAERAVLEGRATVEDAGRERLAAFGEWARRVSGNLDILSYDERRMALDALGVTVDIFQVDDQHRPRWRVMMRPLPVLDSGIASRYA